MMDVISIYGYHDASLSIKKNGKYHIYEAERVFKKRYAILTREYISAGPEYGPTEDQFFKFFNYIKDRHDIKSVDVCYYSELCQSDLDVINTIFNVKKFQLFGHHKSHAYNVFLQSKFNDAHIISYDGHGKNEDLSLSSFTYWKGNGTEIKLIHDFLPISEHNLGGAYLGLGIPLSSIKKVNNGPASGLSISGKLMGLNAYGKVVDEWKTHFEKFFDCATVYNGDILSKNLGFDTAEENILSGQIEYDFAATTQWAFENKFFKNFNSLNIPRGSNICLSGGCALNIKVNQMLYDMGYNVFVSPNPSDCGLSIGPLLAHYNDKSVDITYNGYPILDPHLTDNEITNIPINDHYVARLLYFGKWTLGYINENSECGPRSLGNRSILCYPDVEGLKDKLNSEIKFREWYRPFGAICKLENIHEYFENACETRHMSFCPTLKPKYRLPAITHVDNTCRIQTITRQQHPKLYDILTHIENMGGIGILLNTSFNIKGKPILTTLEDAYDVLKQTKLNGFVYNNNLYTKK